MKIKNLLLGLAVLFTLGAVSCSEDDDDGGSTGGGAVAIDCATFATTDYLPLLEALTDAQEAYTEDQSKENCEAYHDALNTYIASWKAYIDKCVPQASAQFESFYAQFETSLAQLSCDQ
ncbi:MAG: hypothetical protein JXR03_12185 [Cyclobacteriaceae bacterium]